MDRAHQRDMSLEMALEFIEDDESVEITPDAMRKRFLKEIVSPPRQAETRLTPLVRCHA